jgi:hypothetical protein
MFIQPQDCQAFIKPSLNAELKSICNKCIWSSSSNQCNWIYQPILTKRRYKSWL